MRARLFLLRLLALALFACAGAARADTAISLWKAFDGRVNFTGTQVSLRTKPNGASNKAACTITAPGTNRTASLSLPLGASVVSAQLYWAGSGPSDSTVTFEGRSVTATRKYTSSTIGGGYNYFGGAADVTDIVRLKGGGTYNFSGLTVSNGSPWCASEAVLGGFSLLVVYSHPTQPERVLNLYEGFRYVQNSEVVVNASNFRWNRTSYPVKEKARVGHITWEGDSTLSQDGERLRFEGTEMTDSFNPEGNQFNSKSNINRDSASYGIDFDAYDTEVVIWSGYDARVSTSYRTGQDLVLLNAEVLLVPTMPISDLSVAIARPGALQVGRNAAYTVTVTNNGPYTDAGPITVTQTLPAGMSFVSGNGTNWSCLASGATVTCTYRAAIAPDTNAAPLTITAGVSTTGDKTTTVTVKGTDDDNAANNAASNTGTAAPAAVTPPPTGATTSYVFTDSACVAGIAIGTAGQTCKTYAASAVGGASKSIYLTAIANGVPTAPSKTAETTASLQFSLDCVNPDSGTVAASYAGATVPACAAAGLPAKWSDAAAVKFPANAVSVAQTFLYNDIGKVKLSLMAGTATASTGEFVVAPSRIVLDSIKYGTLENPGSIKGDGAAFAPAGADLTLQVRALLASPPGTTVYAPNFGNEDTPPELPLSISKAVELPSQGELSQVPPVWDKSAHLATITASWSEVGATNFVLGLPDPDVPGGTLVTYLGATVKGNTVPVGRFYPAYFKTIPLGPFDCPKSLPEAYTCPRESRGAVYSGQPFDVTVEAYNANNNLVQNFNGDWYRDITLTAVRANGDVATATPLTTPTGTVPVVIGKPAKVTDPATKLDTYPVQGRARFALANAYVDTQPGAAVSEPRTIFVRAAANLGSTTSEIVISSLRSGDEVSEDGGMLVLNGRLKLPNALGTDTLVTPLGLRAEYFAGAAGWLFNPGFADSPGGGVTAGEVAVLACGGKFLDAGEVCANVIGAAGPARIPMAAGKGVLRLRAPGKRAGGAARSGTVTLRYNAWTWLPSTTGRITFGSYRTPVIYVRELYF